MSTEMVTTVKRLVLEKLWWGTKFIETQEDLIEETKRIADLLGFKDPAEKAMWISASILSCCVECLQQRMAVHKQLLF
jgi:hypothetical protein